MASKDEKHLFDLLIQAVKPNGWIDVAAIDATRKALDGPTENPYLDPGTVATLEEAYAADDAVLGPQEAATVQIPDAETGEPLDVVLSPDAASGDDPEPLPA